MGKEKGVTKNHKGTIIVTSYKNVCSGHGYGVWWKKSHEQNHEIKTPISPKLQPKSASQAMHSTQLPQNSITYDGFILANRVTPAVQPKPRIETMLIQSIGGHFDLSVVGGTELKSRKRAFIADMPF